MNTATQLLTKFDRECLFEMLAEHLTYEVDYDDYVNFYTDFRNEMVQWYGESDDYPPVEELLSIQIEDFYYECMLELCSCKEDAELVEEAIAAGCITSLEEFLAED